MSAYSPTSNKNAVDESYKHMIPCGTYTMREGNADSHGGDGINGTIVVPQSKVAAAGAGPKQKVRVKVEANGKKRTMERKIHSGGNTLTIPLEEREALDLKPGDTIEFWIQAIENEDSDYLGQETLDGGGTEISQDNRDSSREETYVFPIDSFTYHLLDSENENQAVCGFTLDETEARTSDEPFDAFDACLECKARSSQPFTDEERINLFAEKVAGFNKSQGEPTNLSSQELDALKQAVLEKEEVEAELREYRARVARLEQRIQQLETDAEE